MPKKSDKHIKTLKLNKKTGRMNVLWKSRKSRIKEMEDLIGKEEWAELNKDAQEFMLHTAGVLDFGPISDKVWKKIMEHK